MTLRNTSPVVIRPHSVSDAIDGNNAFEGAMAALTNLIPSPATADQMVPRPARDVLANIQFLYSTAGPGFPAVGITQISNHIVVGNVLYGLAVSTGGKDFPFAISLPNGTALTVSGINFSNLPTSPSPIGQTQKPLFAQVGSRIVVTHPGFAGGIYNPVGFTTTVTGNVHAGSQIIDGFFPTANIFPGMGLSAASGNIPASTFIAGISSVDFNALGQGLVNTFQFNVTDPTGIVPGMMVSGGNGGIQGFVASISGFVITMDRVLTASFANALVSFHGVQVLMSGPATGETSGDTITISSTANPTNKFGWFDISGASLVQPNCTLNGTTIALVPDVVGIQPGLLVSGTGIAAGTMVVDLANPNVYVAGNPPVFGQTFVTLNYGQLPGDSPPFTFPIVGQTVVGLGLNQGTTVTSVTVISQTTSTAQVQIGLSVAALGSSAGFGGSVPTYNLSGVQEVILSQPATGSGTVTLTFTGGTPTAPLWGTGDTAINHLPSTPLGVGSFNGRAYFACGLNGIPFSDSLLPCVRTNARQAIVPGDGLAVTHCVGQPLASPITGGVVQALYAFQGIGAILQITGDPATNNLAVNPLNIQTGTLAPASATPTTLGMAFVSPEGLRIIDFSGTISQPIGESGQGVAVPLINAADPTRIVAAANGSVLRIALKVPYFFTPATVEFWYDLVRKVWTGPHTCPTTAIDSWNDTFIVNNENVGAQLYTSPVDTTGVTDYEEDGNTLTWMERFVLLPTHGDMSGHTIVESTLGMLLPSDKPVTVTAYDEAGAILDQVQIPANYTNPLWGGNVTPNLWGTGRWYAVDGFFRQHPIPWNKPLVFKQVSFSISGTSRFGLALGSLELRMERLGYVLEYKPEIPLAISVPPLPFTPGTATPAPQTIASISPTSFTIVGGMGSAGELVGTFGATMIPAAPTFAGTWSISGPNANLFTINPGSGQLNVGAANISTGSYQITVTATPTTIGIPPLAQSVAITVVVSLPQMITAITPSAATFVGGTGSAGNTVTMFAATVSPPTPAFMGTWSISGPNASLFTINATTGALTVGATDVAPGSYPLTVTATSFSQVSFSMNVMLTGASPPQRIVAVSPSSFSFVTTATGPVATFTATMSPSAPAFAGTWSVAGNAAFSINSSTGVLSTTGIAAGAYGLTVTATQAGAMNSPFAQSVVVTVTTTPPPQVIVGISPSLAGLTGGAGSAGTTITTFAATLSPPTPAFAGTWSLDGANGSLFTLNAATGTLAVGAADIAPGTYSITVTASQTGLTPLTQNVTVTAATPPQRIVGISPTSLSFAATTVPEAVATFTAQMSPASPAFGGTWSVNTNSFFTISAGGLLSVSNTNGIPAGSYSITVTATQAGATGSPFSQSVAVTVTAVPPPPQAIVGISPSSAGLVGGAGTAGHAITTFAATLSPATPAFAGTWSLGGTDAARFTLNATTGALSVGGSDLAVGTYAISVTATQAGLTGSPFTQNVTVTASVPNPTQAIIAVSPTSLSFLSTATGAVATFTATMSPATPAFAGTWSVGGAAAFSINATTGVLSTTGIAAGTYGLTVTATQSGATNSPFTQSVVVTVTAPPPPQQAIVGISPSAAGLTAGVGTAGQVITTMAAVLSPVTPNFAGTWLIGGTNAGLFTLNAATGVLAVGPSDITAGTYSITVTATQSGLNGSPFTQNVTVTAIAPGAAIGFSAVVTLFGSATYNADGTVTGTPNGTVYTYNPDAPDSHTVATNLGNFVSDFAGFTQGCVHCVRNDTALRVFFRKDVSPDPTRIEIILELGKFTYDGSAANLGPFSLQILKAGVPQNIPVNTKAGAGNTWVPGGISFSGTSQVTTAYFPQLGWATRWRWNPTPRARVRTGSQLLPGSLNLVPKFSAALAASYNVADCGNAGFSAGQSSLGTNGVVTAYSSAFAPSAGGTQRNYNPTGVNEGCTIGTNMGGTGGRPELGPVTEWNANYIVDGNAAALAATMVHGEVDGGLPLAIRDSTTNWAPVNFFNTPRVAFFPGQANFGSPNVDSPLVPEPSGLDGGLWFPDLNHMPLLSYVPYLLTGDPFFLENMQLMASFLVGANYFNRTAGFFVNGSDPNTPTSDPFQQSFPSWRYATRGLAWALRTYTACFLATPASTPTWLQPRSYWDAMLTANATFGNKWGPDYDTANPSLPQYPNQVAVGILLSANPYDEIFFHAYLMMGGSFALNQGGRSEWKHYLTWAAISPLEYGDGTNGAPKTWPVPYIMPMLPVGTDYNGAPAAFNHPADGITWLANNAQNTQTYTKAIPWSWGSLSNVPVFGNQWLTGTTYHCNSWLVEMRSGVPVLPNVGDVCSVTFTGSFAGSPVTISHTVTAGDIGNASTSGTLAGSAANLLNFLNFAGAGANPVIDALLTAINANASLAAAGIQASYTNANPGTGSFNRGFSGNGAGRIWISYNSDGTSTGGGPVIGNVTVTASMTTSTNNTMYVSPNGDGVNFGIHNPACFGRKVCYQAGKSGVSTAAPSGTTPQALTGDLNWCYSPEFKSSPLIVPGGFSSTLPQIGYGGIYGFEPMAPNYVDWLRAGVAGYQTQAIAGASDAYTTWKAIFDFYAPTGFLSQFNFSMVP